MTDSPSRFRNRVVVIAVLSTIWMGLIGYRLYGLQVNQGSDLSARAERQQQQVIELNPQRGSVLDRNGRELVRSIEVESVYASPHEINDKATVAKKLARSLNMDAATITDRLDNGHAYVAIKRRITFAESDALKALDLPGIHLVKEPKRFYPQNELAAQLLGLDNIDGNGVSGIELAFDNALHGKAGKISLLTDAEHRAYDQEEQPAIPGQSVTLTLDSAIQVFTEQTLAEELQTSGAESGVVVVIQPRTGEVLAMASAPSFNPNQISASKTNSLANRAIEIPYEPGSVFKMITYSAAVEEKIINPDTLIDAQGGTITISGHTIRDGGHYGQLRAADALAKSSNVAAIKIGQKLGQQKLYEYIRRFGIGDRIGRDREFANECRGIVRDIKHWSDASYGSIPIGYEVAATPLQLAAVISTIANDGVMVQPHIVKKVSSDSGQVEMASPTAKRVISRDTAATMREMLAGVVQNGTAKEARLAGFTSGGKTGTAHKFDQTTKRYWPNHYYASFAGFAPVNNPQLAMIVMINDPKGAYHGGQVAAPVFKRIAEFALDRLGVQPDADNRPAIVAVSNHSNNGVIADSESNDEAALPAGAGLQDIPTADAIAKNIEQQVAATTNAQTTVQSDSQQSQNSARVAVATGARTIIPDLKGHGVRGAAEICARMGLKPVAKGSGVVVDQKPKAGTAVEAGTVCYLTLSK